MLSGGDPPRFRPGFVEAGGVRLAAFEAGSRDPGAPAVVLLHGLGHWSEGAWGRLIPRLDPALRYVALDLPGFGASEKPAARYDRAFFRRVVDAALDALGVARVALVGHSLGGFLAADYAGRHPERVTHLSLIAPGGFVRSLRFAAFGIAGRLAPIAFALAPSRRLVLAALRRSVVDPRALDEATVERGLALAAQRPVRRAFAGVYADALRTFARQRATRHELARYHGPVLCAWGARDRFIPARAMSAVVSVYPHARTLLLPASAHLPMLEEPESLAAVLRAFLLS
ncbi:MAG TPA: alpha/beta fold hydrolase [Candidatus Baltobacteraceae bacterium]|nr:alpha/beta fold hydrolase [Candidatus Baltobacteraceae bacterium]